MIFNGDYLADIVNAGIDSFVIQRFERVHVENSCAYALALKLARGIQCKAHRIADRDYRNVLTVAQTDSLADCKLLILVIYDGNGVAREAQIHRAVARTSFLAET